MIKIFLLSPALSEGPSLRPAAVRAPSFTAGFAC
jgi:hypothetical protein